MGRQTSFTNGSVSLKLFPNVGYGDVSFMSGRNFVSVIHCSDFAFPCFSRHENLIVGQLLLQNDCVICQLGLVGIALQRSVT